MYYLSRVSEPVCVCAVYVRFHCIWIGEKEGVLEFRDNPPRGFQRAVNLAFFIGSSRGALLQRININRRWHEFIMCGRRQGK